MATNKARTPNSRAAFCNKCGKLIGIGQGFYLGKRGKGRTDFYLHVSCDELRKSEAAARKKYRLEQAAKKKRMDQVHLFEIRVPKHPTKYGCGCTGSLPPA